MSRPITKFYNSDDEKATTTELLQTKRGHFPFK